MEKLNNKNHYKIGTRGSLLALTQCTVTKNLIESLTDSTFELIPISTQGDQIVDKPLWQLDGKDFFTKELDHALLTNEVDLVVHSYKDLGTERPEGIKLQTITERKYANDIILIKNNTIKEIPNLKTFIMGTSSPRRTVNLNKKLKDFLPGASKDLKVECRSVRGNVNTRIEKLLSGEYHAITLALAGLERLTKMEKSSAIVAELLKDMNFMILPQKVFTSAASQGALAIECKDDTSNVLQKTLSSVHHTLTASEMKRERKAFGSYGGGCHLAVGINVKKVHDFYVHIHEGEVDKKEISILKLEGFDYSPLKGLKAYHVIGDKDFLIEKSSINSVIPEDLNIFNTSTYCNHNLPTSYSSLWSAGNSTMKKLIADGHWVNGSAEGFGHDVIENYKNSGAVQLMLSGKTWGVLSHDKASSTVGEVIPSYTHKLKENCEVSIEMQAADIILWSSVIQFKMYLEFFPELKSKKHACGLGKTFTLIKEQMTEDGKSKLIPCIDHQHLLNQTK